MGYSNCEVVKMCSAFDNMDKVNSIKNRYVLPSLETPGIGGHSVSIQEVPCVILSCETEEAVDIAYEKGIYHYLILINGGSPPFGERHGERFWYRQAFDSFKPEEKDNVNHPKHYTSSKAACSNCKESIECIEITRHMSFNIGNAVKYLWRHELKGGIEDLKKAQWYIKDAIEQMEKK